VGEQFAEVAASLARDPALRDRTHLLGISFDPEFDTPTVLRRWGLRYVKEGGFDRFELATGEPAEIARLAGFLTLDYEKDGASFTHNLRTAVFSPDGTLFRLHRGNDWTPAMLLADLREAGPRPRPTP
jgi:protein SCO1/2